VFSDSTTDLQSSKLDKISHRFSRVLVVDDSKLNRKMLSRQLKDYFIEIVEAEDGMEGVRCVEESVTAKQPFDLIFMDNVMPNMTGPKATRLIRTTCGYKGMVVALTGSVLEDDVQDFLSSGATSVIAKPMQQVELERILSGESSLLPLLAHFLSFCSLLL
jgi:CheY-like chemotaxis protein